MADYRDYVGGSYLKAEDFVGRSVRVTIESVKPEKVKNDDGDETKLVARFVGKDKGLTLNKTNLETLALLSNSTDYEQWRGLLCELYHDPTVKMGSKVVGGLRLRQAHAGSAPTPPPPPPQPVTEDDIPF
jgi:hypothetical protein